MWKCPHCGSTKLKVSVEVAAYLHQDPDGENFETEIDGGDHYWDDRSQMTCRECNYVDDVSMFAVGDEP